MSRKWRADGGGFPAPRQIRSLWAAAFCIALVPSGCARGGFDAFGGSDQLIGVRDGIVVDTAGDAALPLDDLAHADAPPPLDWGGTVMPAMWKTIPAGTFTMGSPLDEGCRSTAEREHQVTLTNAFELQSTEVTQAQFESLMGYNPSFFSASGGGPECGDNCPVEQVNSWESVAYCNALSLEEGLTSCYDCTGSEANVRCTVKSDYAGSNIYDCPGYRLPTEAEFEYAYRAGTTTAYYGGAIDSADCYDCAIPDANLDSIGWYCGNSDDTTHAVAQKAANAWGLYDMAGNVVEWSHDWMGSYPDPPEAVTNPTGPASSNTRLARGGYYKAAPHRARAAARFHGTPNVQQSFIGFRCARTR